MTETEMQSYIEEYLKDHLSVIQKIIFCIYKLLPLSWQYKIYIALGGVDVLADESSEVIESEDDIDYAEDDDTEVSE